jgi:hypothetical protein
MTVQELITELAKMPQDYEIDPSGENGVDLGSRVNMDPKTQFKLFKELVETWEIEMSQAEYLKLLERIALFVDDHLIENDAPIEEGYPEDWISERPVVTIFAGNVWKKDGGRIRLSRPNKAFFRADKDATLGSVLAEHRDLVDPPSGQKFRRP